MTPFPRGWSITVDKRVAPVGQGRTGNSFTSVSGNLPDTVVNVVTVHNKQLYVGTDVGAYVSSNLSGSSWAALGGSALPNVPVLDIRANPGASNLLTVATFGRGLYCYQLPIPGKATCATRGANFKPPSTTTTSNRPLATTGLRVGVPVTAALLIAAALLLATHRRRRPCRAG